MFTIYQAHGYTLSRGTIELTEGYRKALQALV
jgi:hypothetical protein